MAGQTQMIIITSNEDLIRQFFLNKTIDTRIIQLDDDKQGNTMMKDDNNIIDLAFLAQLSEHNSKNDQVYKRALDSPHHNKSKQVKSSKKSVDFICTVCGDHAIGYNYDALSCASCKAFFRRNANQPPEKIRCLIGQHQCSVSYETRRKCQRCRLDRCFAVGMRKEFIQSEEEKQQKKKCLEENRKISSTSESTDSTQPLSNSESLSETLDDIDRLMADIDQAGGNTLLHESAILNTMVDRSLETLSVEDYITIQSVRSSLLSTLQYDHTPVFSFEMSDKASALISWSQRLDQFAQRSINFFRQIDEFESLHADDRFILIKYNLLAAFPIFKCFIKSINDHCSDAANEMAEKHRQFFILCGDSYGVHDSFINLVVLLVEATGQDTTLLSLLLAVLIFSKGLSMNEDEPPLKDPLAVNRAQSHYIEVLWKYLLSEQGEVGACRNFIQLLSIIFRIQSVSKTYRDFFRTQFMISNTVDRMAPLMQTVLHIA